MNLSAILRRIVTGVAVSLLVALLALSPQSGAGVASAAIPPRGTVCTSNPSSTFTLTTRTGSIQLPDANTIYMWGYSEGNKPFQHPGPILCVNQGDTVTIVLKNTLPVDTSIIFPGQENVLANGALAQPQFDGMGVMTSLTNVAAANGGSVTYTFVANEPGTYLYQSGTNSSFQSQMGLFGALIVHPTLGANFVYNDPTTEFNPENDYILILSEIDPILHMAVEQGALSYDMSQYRARYWMVNGRSFPDTIAANGVSWLPAQPYGSLVRIHPYDASANPLPALSRYVNVGPVEYPFHPHGNNGRVIARDGRALKSDTNQDLSYEKYTVNIGPGQTADTFFSWVNLDNYDPETNPIPVLVPGEQNTTVGLLYSGSPYLGANEPLLPGVISYNQCGEYYHAAHNHALSTITAWGLTMSGQLTFTRIDPPLPNGCPQ